jgi:hypothetical protein
LSTSWKEPTVFTKTRGDGTSIEVNFEQFKAEVRSTEQADPPPPGTAYYYAPGDDGRPVRVKACGIGAPSAEEVAARIAAGESQAIANARPAGGCTYFTR